MGGERLWIPGVKESNPKRLGFKIGKMRRDCARNNGNFSLAGGTREKLNPLKERILKQIHLIPKWRPVNYSFVCMLISPLRLVNMYKKQKNFEVKMRLRGLVNQQTKE